MMLLVESIRRAGPQELLWHYMNICTLAPATHLNRSRQRPVVDGCLCYVGYSVTPQQACEAGQYSCCNPVSVTRSEAELGGCTHL
jgi:hypothetical protein